MATLKENVKRMIEAGVPEEEIGAFIQRHGGQKPVAPETPVQSSLGEDVRRGLGLGTRTALRSLGGIPQALGNIVPGAVNTVSGLFGGDDVLPYFANAGDTLADAAGLPTPENESEQFYDSIGQAVGTLPVTMGTGAVMQVGKAANAIPSVVRGIGQILTASPKTQAASTLTGALASEGAREAGLGPEAQLAASLLGGSVPAAAVGGVQAGQRAMGRLVDPNKLAAFQRAGIEPPSLGAVSGNASVQRLESGLEQNVFSSGVMGRAAERGRQGLTNMVDDAADRLSGGRRLPYDYEDLGAMVRKDAVASKEAWQKRAQAFEDKTYAPAERLPARLDHTLAEIEKGALRQIPDGFVASESADAYRKGVQNMLGPTYRDSLPQYSIQGNTLSVEDLANNPTLARMARETPGPLSVGSLRARRQAIGESLKAPPTADTAGIAQFEKGRYYGSLNRDIMEALPAPVRGKIEAYNRDYATRKSLGQSVEDIFLKGRDNVSVAKAILNAEGKQLEALRLVLGPESFDTVRGAALIFLARDNNGNISAAALAKALGSGKGSLPQKAQQILFGTEQRNVRDVAKALQGSRIYQNTSNTAGANSVMDALRRFGAGGAGAALAGVKGLVTSGLTSNLLARGMTSPKMIQRLDRWRSQPYAPVRGVVAPLGASIINRGDDRKRSPGFGAGPRR